MSDHYVARIAFQKVSTPDPISIAGRYPTEAERLQIETSQRERRKITTIANIVVAAPDIDKLREKVNAHVSIVEDGGSIEEERITR